MTFVLIGKNIHVTYWLENQGRREGGRGREEKKNTKLPSLVGQEEGLEEGEEEEEGGKSTSLLVSS